MGIANKLHGQLQEVLAITSNPSSPQRSPGRGPGGTTPTRVRQSVGHFPMIADDLYDSPMDERSRNTSRIANQQRFQGPNKQYQGTQVQQTDYRYPSGASIMRTPEAKPSGQLNPASSLKDSAPLRFERF